MVRTVHCAAWPHQFEQGDDVVEKGDASVVLERCGALRGNLHRQPNISPDTMPPTKTMKCFVIMPYGNRERDVVRKRELDSLYEHIIRPAVEVVTVPGSNSEHILCDRGDKEPGPGEIITHIIKNLVLSDLAIADLSGRNPNVFYELGVRHAVNDNTILISESEEDVPFDLRGQRLILYKRDFEGGSRLRNAITKAVQDIVHSPGRIDNPVRRFLFDREREKMLEKIEAQGQPPGYDFVNELLQEMSNLRKDFKAQLDEVRNMMEAVTAPQSEPATAHGKESLDGLDFVEGAWQADSGSHLYARIVQGQLLMPYCYGGNDYLTGHFYNFRRIGKNIFARFQWLGGSEISGYAQWEIKSQDDLVGGWWYAKGVPDEVVYDITCITHSMPGIHPYELHRTLGKSFPKWAEDYFQGRQSAQSATNCPDRGKEPF